MKNQKVQLLVGIAVSAFFLYLTLRPVKFRDLWDAIRTFNWLWAVPFLVVTFISMYARAIRWHYLMKPTANLSSYRLYSPMMAGFAINSLLPARIGEFARAYILGIKEKLPFTSVFATIVVERIFDSLALLGMLLIVFATMKFDPTISESYNTVQNLSQVQARAAMAAVAVGLLLIGGILWYLLLGPGRMILRRRMLRSRAPESVPQWLQTSESGDLAAPSGIARVAVAALLCVPAVLLLWSATGKGFPATVTLGRVYDINAAMLEPFAHKVAKLLAVMMAGSLLLLFPATRSFIQRMIEKVPFAPRGIRLKINGLISSFAEGLASLKDVRSSIIILLLSAVVWLLIAWTFQILAYGFTGLRISFLQGIALTVISCIAIIIPAAPGYWGLMEIGIVFGLKVLGIEKNEGRAVAYALILHALQYFPITGVGLYYLWKERVSIGEISKGTQQK